MKQGFKITVIAILAFAGGAILRQPLLSLLHSHDNESASPATAPSDKKQLWTCSMHPQVIQDHPGFCPICHMELTPLKESGASGGAIQIDPVIVQNMGVRTAPVTEGPIAQQVRVIGYLEEPEPFHRDINLRISGWIEKLYANIDGMPIEEGKPLFDLYSPELMVAIDEMIAARKQLASSAGEGTAQTLLDSARRKLLQYGLTEKQIEDLSQQSKAPATVPILSPMSGHLTAKMVYEGAAVKAGDLVLRLASRHRMWIDAQVYEQQYPLVKIGAKAAATLSAQPGQTFEGQVIFIHPHVDPVTRTALVRIEIPNQNQMLRQGMYATVEIESADTHPLKLVPREAVIDSGEKQIAFVSLGEGKFEARRLKLGIASSDRVQVLDGLELGENVVTSGQFLLDSESRLREAIAKHLTAGLPGHAGHGNSTGQSRAPAVSVETSPTTRPVVTVPHTDDILAAYLGIQQKLGAKQQSDTPIDVSALSKVASMAAHHASDDAAPLASAVAKAADAMTDQPLPMQRERFIDLSDAVIAMVQSSKPSAKIAKTLFIARCPMAFDEKGANWIQLSESIANPYFATEMKTCGTIQQRIDLDK
jgi:Cu(I)/Ag(I) efflux system membrane fusion protein